MSIDVKALRERLKNGSFTEADLAEGQEIIKSLRAGSATPESLGLASPPPEAPAAALPTVPTVPAAKIETPASEGMRKAMDANPEAARALNAVPALQAVVKNQEELATAQALIAKSLAELSEAVSQIVPFMKSLSLPAAPVAPPADSRGDERAQFGEDVKKALDQALEASGLGAKLAELDAAVNHRPYSGNPPRAQAAVRKGVQVERFTKSMATTVVQKALGAKQIGEDEACRALEVLDMAQHVGKSYEDICRQVAPQMLKDFLGE